MVALKVPWNGRIKCRWGPKQETREIPTGTCNDSESFAANQNSCVMALTQKKKKEVVQVTKKNQKRTKDSMIVNRPSNQVTGRWRHTRVKGKKNKCRTKKSRKERTIRRTKKNRNVVVVGRTGISLGCSLFRTHQSARAWTSIQRKKNSKIKKKRSSSEMTSFVRGGNGKEVLFFFSWKKMFSSSWLRFHRRNISLKKKLNFRSIVKLRNGSINSKMMSSNKMDGIFFIWNKMFITPLGDQSECNEM